MIRVTCIFPVSYKVNKIYNSDGKAKKLNSELSLRYDIEFLFYVLYCRHNILNVPCIHSIAVSSKRGLIECKSYSAYLR